MFNINSIFQKAALIRDAVFAANDGIITTFAVVAGSQGAQFNTRVIIVLGIANLFADGFSMAAGSYLGNKSQQDVIKTKKDHSGMIISPIKNSLVTFMTFVIAGTFPLLPYFFDIGDGHKFYISMALVFITISILGLLRGMATNKNYLWTLIETLLVGSIGAYVAYIIGDLSRVLFNVS